MSLPHASLLIGTEKSAQDYIALCARDISVPVEIHTQAFASLGIEDVRDIKELHAETTKESGSVRFICVSALSFTQPAQNALLKLTEEPNDGTYLFLSTPRTEELLPTLLSRCQVVPLTDTKNEFEEKAQLFLSGSLVDRLTIVGEIHAEMDDVDESSEARNIFHTFLDALEIAYKPLLEQNKISQTFGTELYEVRSWASFTGTSAKQMLEYLALAL